MYFLLGLTDLAFVNMCLFLIEWKIKKRYHSQLLKIFDYPISFMFLNHIYQAMLYLLQKIVYHLQFQIYKVN